MRYVVITLCFALAACDTGAMRRMSDCQKQAGRQPLAGAGLFGVAGLIAAHQDPERAAWDERVNQCVREAKR